MTELAAVPGARRRGERRRPRRSPCCGFSARSASAELQGGGDRGGGPGDRGRRARPGLGGGDRLADDRQVLALQRRRRPAGVGHGELRLRHGRARPVGPHRPRQGRQDQGRLGRRRRRACSTRPGWPRRTTRSSSSSRSSPRTPAQRLAKAVAAGECPSKPDEVDDLTAHRALLHARVRYLAAN